MTRRRLALIAVLAGAIALFGVQAGAASQKKSPPPPTAKQRMAMIKHVVVFYEENHSFDNLYGGWEGVNGLSKATATEKTQVGQTGTPFTCLMTLDVNLAALPATCTDTTTGTSFSSAFTNAPYLIDTYIKPTDTTCPNPAVAFSSPNGFKNGTGLAGGCTRDLVHEFYQEQYQLNAGAQNRYPTGSDSAGMTLGFYDTKALPIYKYLHTNGHPRYAILDDFFQGAFGGSFLNHQWLIAAAPPTYPSPPDSLRSIIDSNGMPVKYPLYTPTGPVQRGPITAVCPAPLGRACGDYAVNTMQPSQQPFGAFGAKLPLQAGTTIGDRLSAAKVSWNWYAGGWSNANGDVNGPGWTNGAGPKCSDVNAISGSTYPNCPDYLFQFHHQPFNYYSNYAPGTAGRAHLQDEAAFITAGQASSKTCKLPAVSIVKPLGEDNGHPGYASTPNGDANLVALVQMVEGGACKKDTMIIVTYDEFGGQWDHVAPPGQGTVTAGPHDMWGPGTRIPALVISPFLKASFVVDHTEHDTSSILATIERRWKLKALGTRDAAVRDLSTVFSAKAAK